MRSAIIKVLHEATEAKKAGQLDLARDLYKKVLLSEPNNPEANFNLGYFAFKQNKIQIALPHLRAAILGNNKNPLYWETYIDSLIRGDQIKLAEEVLDVALEFGLGESWKNRMHRKLDNPGKEISSIYQASQELININNLIREQSLDEAVLQAQNLAQKFPTNPEFYNLLGLMSNQLGCPANAIGYYKQAISLNPTLSESHKSLAKVYRFSAQISKAIVHFNRAAQLDPINDDTYYNLADILVEHGNHKEALNFYAKVTILTPSDVNAQYNYANALQNLSRYTEAIQKYEQGIQLSPDSPLLYLNQGNALTHSVRYKAAIMRYKNVLCLEPSCANAYFSLSNALIGLGVYKTSSWTLRKAIYIKPDFAEAYCNLGYVLTLGNALESLDKLAEAIKLLFKSVQLEPASAISYANLGGAFKNVGKQQKALRCYERAKLIDPSLVSVGHFIDALTGTLTEHPPREYVEGLFDTYAERFDDHLVRLLDYQVPSFLRSLHDKCFPSPQTYQNLLDLGCGTGLSGLAFRDISERMTGIDLSVNMIAKAREKELYDKLIVGDIVEVIDTLYAENATYDLFLCVDVLIYIGDCKQLFTAVNKILAVNPLFIFSTENYDGRGYNLMPSGRYSHSYSYISRCAKLVGLEIIAFETSFLRIDRTNTLTAGLYILGRNTC